MSTHTPGPWEAWAVTCEKHLIHRQTEHDSGGYFCEVQSLHHTEEARVIAAANARLIAAAPDLLAACRAAEVRLHNAIQTLGNLAANAPEDSVHAAELTWTKDALSTCRAAIAKAKGQ